MTILFEGYLIEDTDVYDPTLANFDVQIVHWLRQYLEARPDSSQEATQM